MIKTILYSSLLLAASLDIQAGQLSKRLWRELDQAKYHDSKHKAQQQDMAWLEESLEKEDSPAVKKETVDQVMAKFNREKKQAQGEDSISLKMAAPQRDSNQNRSPALAPESRRRLLKQYEKKLRRKDAPLTRQRSR